MDRTARPLSIVALLVLLAGAVPTVLAREAVVTTHSGRTFTGELISESPNEVVLRIAGIRTPIPRDTIASLELKKTPDEIHAERRAALADDDLEGRYQLALDLYNDKALQVSRRELESIKTDFPDAELTDVNNLLELVQLQIRLQQEQAQPQPRPTPARPQDGSPERARPTREAGDASPLLTAEQINVIRLWELPADLAEARPRVRVPREVIDELFERYASHDAVPKGRVEQQRFRSQEGWRQLQVLFRVKARDLYPKVIISEDPPALIEFRRTINPIYVARYFREHFSDGKVEGLDLKLLARDPGSIAEAYTNFYILSQAEFDGRRLIDRDQPEESLLIQWGLPRDAAKYPAPEVPNWRPFFRTGDDPRIEQYVAWVRSLYKPMPAYGITYPPRPEGQESADDVEAGAASGQTP